MHHLSCFVPTHTSFFANGAPRASISQERVFYTKEWTKEVDGVFIRALTQQTLEARLVHYPLDHSIDCDDAAWSAICQYDALGLAYMRKGEAEFDNLQYIVTAGHGSENEADELQVIGNSSDPDDSTTPTEEADEGQNNAFSYELAWYTSSTCSAASGSSFSSLSGASSTVKKSVGKKHSSKRPPVPRCPAGSGPSSVASSSPFKRV